MINISNETSALIIESERVEVLMDDKARFATVMALKETHVSVIDHKGFNE